MREIKFRVWHKADEKMYEVYGFAQNKWFLKGKQFPMPNGSVVIMQYTGLKDKNGKEIYEGDICETVTYSGKPFGTIDVVKFSGGAFKLTDIEDALLPIPLDDSDIQSVEVIGNIYENPELLEWKE
ncbi:YopX family protein [Caldifermentibacillus hisashii]|uniref:YopX family protein n=1 Tax=Caldifermentibacillus hisashii TaxID=996558 RepID=UPI0031FBF82A